MNRDVYTPSMVAFDENEDRPKKSWREIDQKKDRSSHRREEKPAGGQRQSARASQAYRAYKSQLNKLFDGGSVPEALESKLDEAGILDEAKKRKQAIIGLLEVNGPEVLKKLLQSFKSEFGFPENEEVLARLLEIEDAEILLEVIATISRLKSSNELKRGNALKARLKTLQMTTDDNEVRLAAKNVLAEI